MSFRWRDVTRYHKSGKNLIKEAAKKGCVGRVDSYLPSVIRCRMANGDGVAPFCSTCVIADQRMKYF